jgi:hypothetical protein
VLGTAGLAFAAIKKDILLLLWFCPFVIFLSTTGFIQYFYWIPLLPSFCIAAARLIVYLTKRIGKNRLQPILPFIIISAIGIFGLASTIAVIATNVSSQFEGMAFVARYLQENNNSGKDSITLISSPVYSWIFYYVFGNDHVFSDYRDILFNPVQTKKVLLIADEHFKSNIGTGIQLQMIYNNTNTIATFKGGVLDFDLNKYPYTSMSVNYEGSIVEIRVSKY